MLEPKFWDNLRRKIKRKIENKSVCPSTVRPLDSLLNSFQINTLPELITKRTFSTSHIKIYNRFIPHEKIVEIYFTYFIARHAVLKVAFQVCHISKWLIRVSPTKTNMPLRQAIFFPSLLTCCSLSYNIQMISINIKKSYSIDTKWFMIFPHFH